MRSKPIKHRARDAGETADLRWQLSVKLPGPAGSLRKASRCGQARFAAGSPWCREVPRSVGPSRPRRPARPRILSSEARMGSEVEMQGGPGAFQTIRAAQRWLNQRAEVG